MNRTMEAILQEIGDVLGMVSERQLALLGEQAEKAVRVFGAGAGRSGLMMKAFIMRLMHMGMTAYVAGEISTPSIQPGDLFIVASGSGETASMRTLAEKAKSIGVRLAVITSQPRSTLASLADDLIEIPARDRGIGSSAVTSVQFGGTWFDQSLLVALDAVVYDLIRKKGIAYDQMYRNHANLE